MVKPPRQTLVGAVFKVNNRVFVAVKLLAVKGVAGFVHRRRIKNSSVAVKNRAVKFGKNCGGRNAVKAVSVIKYAKFHIIFSALRAKHFRLIGEFVFVKRKIMNIRIEQIQDTAALVEFNQAMALETEGKQLNSNILRQGVEAVFSDAKKGFYVVAEEDGEIVGGLMVTFEWSDWRDNWFWWIQSVYILPAGRGKKIYSRLYDFVKEKARESKEVCGIRLYVEKENANAQKVYEKLGMKASHYLMYEETL